MLEWMAHKATSSNGDNQLMAAMDMAMVVTNNNGDHKAAWVAWAAVQEWVEDGLQITAEATNTVTIKQNKEN
jgi:hypothetical protein